MTNWKTEQGPFVNNATLEGKERAEIWFEGEGFDVTLEEGSGYMMQSNRRFIPLEVITSMLRHAGYTITPPEGTPEREV